MVRSSFKIKGFPSKQEIDIEATRHCNDSSFQEQYRVWYEAIEWISEFYNNTQMELSNPAPSIGENPIDSDKIVHKNATMNTSKDLNMDEERIWTDENMKEFGLAVVLYQAGGHWQKSLKELLADFKQSFSGQSNTAPKAETRKWNEELNHWEPYAKAEPQPTAGGSETHCDQTEIDLWQRIFDRCKEIYPLKKATDKYIEIVGILKPQPTAGWVKLYTQKAVDDYTNAFKKEYIHKDEYNKIWEALAECEEKRNNTQPSPSNPSIKRPTERKIDGAAWDYAKKQICADKEQEDFAYNDFKAGINWLLSLQSDNKI